MPAKTSKVQVRRPRSWRQEKQTGNYRITSKCTLSVMMAVMRTEAVSSWRMITHVQHATLLLLVFVVVFFPHKSQGDSQRKLQCVFLMFTLCWRQNDNCQLARGLLTLNSHAHKIGDCYCFLPILVGSCESGASLKIAALSPILKWKTWNASL